jgi:hypothetical protein
MEDICEHYVCNICYEKIPEEFYDLHNTECKIEQSNALNNLEKDYDLTLAQQNALKYVNKKSKIFIKNVKMQINADFLTKNYNLEDIDKIIKYIQNDVQIVIHININKDLQYFLNDNHYKNIFEIPEKKGIFYLKQRNEWEDFLFSKSYSDDNIEPIEKVKYGTLNLLNNSAGVMSCISFGDSYFVLKNNIKKRTTFSYGNSLAKDMQNFYITNFKNCLSILSSINPTLLEMLIKIVNNENIDNNYNYKCIEAQIHGSIFFNRDIEKMVVKKHYQQNNDIQHMLNEFSLKNNVPIEYV